MRKTLAISILAALGAATAGAGALNDITLQGSDTLKDLTVDELTSPNPWCNLANPDGVNDLTASPGSGLGYVGGGSGTAESAMSGASPSQTVGPMSRVLKPTASGAVCSNTNFANAEGIVFALDGVSMVASAASAGACDSGPDDCDQATDSTSGLLHNNAQIAVKKSIPLPGGGSYTPADWREVLRIVYAGMTLGAPNNTLATRDCNSDLRKALIGTWSNLFQNDCTSCVSLRHAFRRAGDSGTTDVFLGSLGLPTFSFLASVTPDTQLNGSPFCNVRRSADTWSAQPLPPLSGTALRTKPYYEEYQDEDPVRTACIGTGNLPSFPAGGQPPSEATEQVCGPLGTLGVVMPISVTAVSGPQGSDLGAPNPYSITPCSKGKFFSSNGPFFNSFQSDRCPNGDPPIGGTKCFYPANTSNSQECLNGANNLPVKLNPAQAIATDGRVYNLHLRTGVGTAGNYQVNNRPNLIPPAGDIRVAVVGAFYRLHATRSGLTATPTSPVCTNDDSTQQIGCLVQSNPCSIGFAGRDAVLAGVAGNTVPLKINGLEPTDTCIQHLVSGGTPTTTYNFARKLYFNTVNGFENVTGQELELAKCYSTLAPATITGHGFVLLPGTGAAFCEDVNTTVCGSDLNGCTDPAHVNPAPIP